MDKIFDKVILNISKARMAKNISAYELSLQIEKDPSYISKLERGKINISLKSLIQICETLEISPKSLF